VQRFRPDGGKVGALFLASFRQLDQHAARTVAPQSRATIDQRIRPLDRLDAEHHALLYDHGLPDVGRAHRT
jgi:hypothetical protein